MFCIVLVAKLPNFNTVGASAVPPKSPANIILPLDVVVASGIPFNIKIGSASAVLTNEVVATALLLSVAVIVPTIAFVPKSTTPVNVGDALSAFNANAAVVKVETGLSASAVFVTLFNPKLINACDNVFAPVPPLPIPTIPDTFVAVPLNVPTNDVAVTFVAVISDAAKFPEPSRVTIVFGMF